MHNASLKDVEARLLPEGAGRSPERPMPALMFIPQPASELVVDIFVNQPEVSSGVEPGEVRTPTPQDRVEPRSLLATETRVSRPMSIRILSRIRCIERREGQQ